MPQLNQGQSDRYGSQYSDSHSDEDIAKLVQAGKSEKFSLLINRYQQKIMRYAGKFLAGYNDIEDIVQNIFLKTYTNIQGFDTAKRFSPWLYRIAHNEFINAIKKRGKEPLPFFEPDIFLPQIKAKENIEKNLEQKELQQMLNACLEKLSVKYREPLILYYFEELAYKEIAEVLHIPVSTVGIRIKRAKQKLKKIWQSNY